MTTIEELALVTNQWELDAIDLDKIPESQTKERFLRNFYNKNVRLVLHKMELGIVSYYRNFLRFATENGDVDKVIKNYMTFMNLYKFSEIYDKIKKKCTLYCLENPVSRPFITAEYINQTRTFNYVTKTLKDLNLIYSITLKYGVDFSSHNLIMSLKKDSDYDYLGILINIYFLSLPGCMVGFLRPGEQNQTISKKRGSEILSRKWCYKLITDYLINFSNFNVHCMREINIKNIRNYDRILYTTKRGYALEVYIGSIQSELAEMIIALCNISVDKEVINKLENIGLIVNEKHRFI